MDVIASKLRSHVDEDDFADRHIGPTDDERAAMLAEIGFDSLDALVDAVVPETIRRREALDLPRRRSEATLLDDARALLRKNVVCRSLIGMGYHDTVTPPVLQRNILENPGWYTQYTPYQAEISQGRLEALLNFQTLVADLTGLPLAGASLLDEGTAAAEALAMCRAITKRHDAPQLVAAGCHPQTIAVVQGRSAALGASLSVVDPFEADIEALAPSAVLLQYPTTTGAVEDYRALAERVHAAGGLVVVACDPLALTLLEAPGVWGADIAVGSSQRFGVPMFFGGPHAAFLATREAYKRQLPGRLVGVSRDADGKPALRLAMQTREQHIRRDRATSNICTAQVLLAIVAAMYAVYHGPQGLVRIAKNVRRHTEAAATALARLGFAPRRQLRFDTLVVDLDEATRAAVIERSRAARINLREDLDGCLGLSFDETADRELVERTVALFGETSLDDAYESEPADYETPFARTAPMLEHPVFHRYRSEHEMLRYLNRLQDRDLSLTHAMIPLGSCTMKLNGTAEMMPLSWPVVARIHPFAPADQCEGYRGMTDELERLLAEITGFAGVSLQPNAGAQGEYAGLLTIVAYHRSRGESDRDVCLIPTSAHGTNPASAVMAGMRVVAVACDERGDIDVADLKAKAEQHRERLGALMVTYPSTHGVFEASIREVCEVIHAAGGQVYMDGANMNAQVGLCRPGDFGADVCHLNLHKTFCIPHGGGGPGVGPIGVAEHLLPFLPGHPLVEVGGEQAIAPISAAPWGSAGILPISWMYIRLMGAGGLQEATSAAILNANYMANKLAPHYPILYTGDGGHVAHEFIIDTRPLREAAGVTVDDIAKRLIDYGFHAPTMSWPVAGTLMIEPTESEGKAELDRFCEAMIAIRKEIQAIADGKADREDNALKRAPHTADAVCADEWGRAYSREQAAFPTASQREWKFWPAVGRVDNAFGDRHLVCSCPPMEAYEDES